jgi:hypothetical protein
MPSVNGVTTPPSATDAQGTSTSATKRKRSESVPQTNGVERSDMTNPAQNVDERILELQADVLTVLQK